VSGDVSERTLELLVTAWMADEGAPSHAPAAVLEDILARTSRTRPASRWLAILKEPPMRTQTGTAVGIPSRGLVIAAILAALLALAVGLALVGAQLLQPPRSTGSDDWPMARGDAARAGRSLTGPVGHPVVRWTFKAGAAVTKNISIVGDSVFVSSDDGILRSLQLDSGTPRWEVSLGGGLSGPSVIGAIVYATDGNGIVQAVDATTGSRRWQSTSQVVGATSASFGDNRVYLGTSDGALVALDARDGTQLWRTRVSASGDIVNSPAFSNGIVFAGTAVDGFYALDAANGAVRWRFDTGQDVTGTAVATDTAVYIGSGTEARTGHLWALDPATGGVLWKVDDPISTPAIADGIGYSVSGIGIVTARDLTTGIERWRIQLSGPVRAPALSQGILYLQADGHHQIFAIDAATGGELWHFDLDSSNVCCTAVAKGSVFVGTNNGTVYAIGGDGAALKPAPIVAAVSETPTPSVSAKSSATAVPSASVGPLLAQFESTVTLPGDASPNGFAYDPAGRIWVVTPYEHRFAILSHEGKFIEFWGKQGTGDGAFNLTRLNGDGYGGIAFAQDGSFFVNDAGNRRVQKFDANRRFVRSWGGYGADPGKYSDPVGIAVGPDGNVYLLDDVRGVVEKYDQDGKILGAIRAFSNTSPGFSKANALAIDSKGNVYVSQIEPNQVAMFDPDGKLVRTFGDTGPGQFNEQAGFMAIDGAGRLYVGQGPERGDRYGYEVFGPDGAYLGGWGLRGTGDGEIAFPTGILLDEKGGLLVGDAGSNGSSPRIDKFKLSPPLAR
jgi:outer membrane protein assembly factor BamB